MRLISQDGRLDAPYENSIIYVDGEKYNKVYVIYNNQKFLFATYPNVEKVDEILALMREKYIIREKYFIFPRKN